MDLGVGLPSTIPATTGPDLLAWARAADDTGFASVGTIDRVVYGNHETIPTMAAVAAVTSRVRLTTAIMIAPFRGNGALLAKQLATVDSISNGRLTVGTAVGGRPDDYTATGTDFDGRGAAFDAQLAEMRDVWGGASRGVAGAIGPRPVQAGGPPLLIGGTGKAAVRRVVTLGAGWIAGGGGVSMFDQFAGRMRAAWAEAGRAGAPRLAALGYYALGPTAGELADELPARLLRLPRRLRGPGRGRRVDQRRRGAAGGGRVRRRRLRRADPVPVLAGSRPAAPAG